MISTAVKKSKKLDEIDEDLEKLGAAHVRYGVHPEHYPMVGATLLKTLEMALGSQWNDASKEAWSNLFSIVSKKMLKGQLTSTQEDLITSQWNQVAQDPDGA